jgi:hypothetical protein
MVASLIYGDLKFIGLSCFSIFILAVVTVFTFFMVLGLVEVAESPLMFQRMDIVFLGISLFKIIIHTLRNTEGKQRESDFSYHWLSNLNWFAFEEIMNLSMVGIPIFLLAYLLFDKLFILGPTHTGFLFLYLNYFLHAGILLWTKGQGLSSIRHRSRASFVRREWSQAYVQKLYSQHDTSNTESEEIVETQDPS